MKVAYIAAGAAGMYCGSCIHDNALAAAMLRLGHDVTLIPTYTPVRTDEDSVSQDRVFYGAINVYLQLKSRFFRHTPRLFDRILDQRRLLQWVSRFAGATDARDLGDLTLAVLQGEQGPQRKELEKLSVWLQELRPDVVHLTNSLFLGMVHQLKADLGVPIVVSLQGEDIFVDDLPADYRQQIESEMRRRAQEVDLFIAPSRYYARVMSKRLGVDQTKIAVVPLGIQLDGYRSTPTEPAAHPVTVGFLARICPEKGLHLLVEALRQLRDQGDTSLRVRAAGYLGSRDEIYLAGLKRQVADWGLEDRFEYIGEIDRDQKLDFLNSLHLFALPTTYPEAKGLSALEAMASGIPTILPDHGSFPEMVAATSGGMLFEALSAGSLATTLRDLADNPQRRNELAMAGHTAVHRDFDDERMAQATLDLYGELVSDREVM
ncbi:MAG: glycosyltransferase family 4 protein [Thermoanaerobaculia bacterium]|nr:glycosyltransferase family 4 protein [Thermoanaerobaculia bacterium]